MKGTKHNYLNYGKVSACMYIYIIYSYTVSSSCGKK